MDRKNKVEENIKEALEKAPKIEGFTIKALSETLGEPYPTVRWHLELMEARGDIDHVALGRAKIYHLKKNKK